MKTKVIILVLSLVFLSAPAYAFRVEGFKWDESRNTVLKTIERKGWAPLESSFQQVVEVETFLRGAPCWITFNFNNALKLKSIRVVWDTLMVGENLKEDLIDKYGDPHRLNQFKKHYEWHGSYDGEEITLDYFHSEYREDRQTRLVFQTK